MTITSSALYRTLALDLRDYSHWGETLSDLLVKYSSFEDISTLVQREFNQWNYLPDDNHHDVCSLRLIQSILKKVSPSRGTSVEQDKTALEKFLAVNNRLESWVLSPNTSLDEELIGSVKELLYFFWNPEGYPLVSNPLSVLDRGRTGPGSSIGMTGEDFYSKMYSSNLTYTSEALSTLYEWWCSEIPLTSHAEILRQSEYGKGTCISGNRLQFVPKDDTVSRTIATEPSLNMYFQLGLGRILEDRINTFFGIDLSFQQQWNQKAALIGSIEGSSFATIDLSSASDSLGLKLLDCLLPPDFFRLLKMFRSPVGTLPSGSAVTYNMISTMGNGYTFPLETMLFASIVVAAIKSFGLTPERPNRSDPTGSKASWGVFGDDIICHPLVFPRVKRLLDLFGFKLNSDKTFVEGPFRESCGHDYFKGHDVRPVYFRRELNSTPALNVAINSLISWSYRTGIKLPETGKLLCQDLRRNGTIYFVPLDESLDSGIRLPTLVLETLGYIPIRNRNRSYLYSRLLAAPKQLRIGDGFISVPKGSKRRIYNAPGLLLAFLRGDVRSGRISIRQTDTRFRVKRCVTPNWDYVPPVSDLIRQAGDRIRIWRLETSSWVIVSSLMRSS